jgi:hypothetical protein
MHWALGSLGCDPGHRSVECDFGGCGARNHRNRPAGAFEVDLNPRTCRPAWTGPRYRLRYGASPHGSVAPEQTRHSSHEFDRSDGRSPADPVP